jgi:Uncharacterised nucleotidyltransferase
MICAEDKECELLISCAREYLGSGRKEEVRTASRGVDWSRMADLAELQGFLPIFYQIVWKSIPKLVPKPIVKDLRFKYLQNSHKNHFLSSELISILDFLESEGLKVLPFKGPVLAEFLYGDESVRYFTDLDLLVLRADAIRARVLLETRGYQQDRQLSREQEAASLKSNHHFHLRNSLTGVHVDLHWKIAPKIYSFSLNVEDLMERSVSRTVQGKKVQTISNEDLLLILCEHGIRHYWKRLIWICDVAMMAKRGDINWTKLIKTASETGCVRALLLGIFLANDLLGVPLPIDNCDIAKRIKMDKEIPVLANEIEHQLFSGKDQNMTRHEEPKANAEEELLYLRARERQRDRALYYLRRITIHNEDDWDSISLPGYLFPLYHFVRPARLLRRYKFSIVKWIKR